MSETTTDMPRVSILTGIFPPDIGGPASSVPDLACGLMGRGVATTVVTLASDGRPAPDDPCRVVRIDKALPHTLRIASVVRAVYGSRPDVVLANGLHLESAVLLRVPVVQKIVGDWAWERATNAGHTYTTIEEFQRERLGPRLAALRSLRSMVARRATRVIVPSRYLAGLVRTWGVAGSRVTVIPNAAPPPDPEPTHGDRSVLFVGRLVRWKHVDDAIRALSRIDGVSLDIVGDGPELGSLKALARSAGLEERVRFRGALSRTGVAERMRAAGVLVLPSSYEGMPHVVLEAFARGLPVVAAQAGGTPEVVRDGVSGLLYPCRKVECLRWALERALESSAGEELRAGAVAAAREFQLATTLDATTRVLVETAASRRQRHGGVSE